MSERERYEKYAKRIKIFSGLTAEDVAFVVRQGRVFQFQQGQTVFHEGTLGSNLFIVLSGQIGISNRGKMIGRCHPGDAFGEMAVLNRRPRCATATALSDVTLLTLSEQDINNVLEKRVAVRFLLNIIQMLSTRLEEADQWIEENRDRLRRPRLSSQNSSEGEKV